MVMSVFTHLLVFGFKAMLELFLSSWDNAGQLPPLIPAVHSFTGSSGTFELPSSLSILVDIKFADSTELEDDGLTLIPPSLLSFAVTFSKDLHHLFPSTSTAVSVVDAAALDGLSDYVFLTLDGSTNHTLASGAHTTEGYEMEITLKGIVVRGSGARGAFWATRTLLQGLVLGDGRFPNGVIEDQPDWATRGIMLDVGRHWYPIGFLKELCAYASWFKMSEFHLHLSDNVNLRDDSDPDSVYARFRLRSTKTEFAGLTPYHNETYSRTEFEDLQQSCAARGVTVVPEIESPGHALVITRWKPHLALAGDPTLINLTEPDAIPTIKAIWEEFLPWFHSKEVSIGADEYDARLADDYNNFVNTMDEFVQRANKTLRIWSTREPSKKTHVNKSVVLQHWARHEGDPLQLIQKGYELINSDEKFQYIVVKQPQPGGFPQHLNQTRLWEGANVEAGGVWDPHIFDRKNASNNPSIADPHVKGAIMAVWNDHGPSASTVLEGYYAFKEGLPVIAAASWQASSRPAHLTHEQFLAGFPVLARSAPGQVLDRPIKSNGSVVARYEVPTGGWIATVKDLSGNGYDALLVKGYVVAPLGSKGHNYTLRVLVDLSEEQAMILVGPDNAFGTVWADKGLTLAFKSSNIEYPLRDYTLPVVGGAVATEIVLAGTESRTSAWVNGDYVGDFVVDIDGSGVLEPMAFVAPVTGLGGPGARVREFTLWDGLQEMSRNG